MPAVSKQAKHQTVSKQAKRQSVSQELMESQMSTPARSTSGTPVGDEESTPPICPCVPARANIHGTRRRAPEPDCNSMLDIMASMSERKNNNRSHEQVSARCLEGLIVKVPSELQADMLASTTRYTATFIQSTTTYRSSEPSPPYGPYASLLPPPLPAPHSLPLPQLPSPHSATHLPLPTSPPSNWQNVNLYLHLVTLWPCHECGDVT
ncbi:hypothetical protein AB205_0168090 [Aquarana catesbeiana]|uniref:Uncharacterized protein n=1 Tax=Aquarana catesbeiana TaxID=8400 RepID=A0A2G9QUD7_AQUCT|nr:hypothetical protein AB205_0168090 [Aquarana catesbeiana]